MSSVIKLWYIPPLVMDSFSESYRRLWRWYRSQTTLQQQNWPEASLRSFQHTFMEADELLPAVYQPAESVGVHLDVSRPRQNKEGPSPLQPPTLTQSAYQLGH